MAFVYVFYIIIISAKQFGNKNDSDGISRPRLHAFEGDWYRTSGKLNMLNRERNSIVSSFSFLL